MRGYLDAEALLDHVLGSTPPRLRGNRPAAQGGLGALGYPRACGETTIRCCAWRPNRGLSRLRGNQADRPRALHRLGSPTPAGEPAMICRIGYLVPVYPRACGGTTTGEGPWCYCEGLSPRLRGNLRCSDPNDTGLRSIPAPAGEPPSGIGSNPASGVYPRACGGTQDVAHGGRADGGLSPRMRGNRNVFPEQSWPYGVYPRACGGTSNMTLKQIREWGLSPRMRGNLLPRLAGRQDTGSIPAHAGEPSDARACPGSPQVYPRACGGTNPEGVLHYEAQGLSPRMRGNRLHGHAVDLAHGSIPAHAGEPGRQQGPDAPPRVYPRACGGTAFAMLTTPRGPGLSPRMRGNPVGPVVRGLHLGSIPAHAGEPPAAASGSVRPGVYPRACGGTGVGRQLQTAV